jgi:two-component system, NarL family, nitrate/nitrite response regulator NarL
VGGNANVGNLCALERVNGAATVKERPVRSPKAIRILIADGQPIFCQGLRKVIETQPDLRVVGETSDGAEALKLAREHAPDILLLDAAIAGLAALRVLRNVQTCAQSVRTIFLAAEAETPETVEALKLGARGVMRKDTSADLVLKAIRCVKAGQHWVRRDKISNVLQSLGKETSPWLNGPLRRNLHVTLREIQIIAAILHGGTNKDIAKQLGLSEDTVKHHLTHIFEKLGVCTRLELALFAMDYDLFRRPSADYTQHISVSSPSH